VRFGKALSNNAPVFSFENTPKYVETVAEQACNWLFFEINPSAW
jgi:hypothetical protein